VRPRSCSVTSTWAVPFPALRAPVLEPYAVVVPYSTYQLVSSPPGPTFPATTAEDAPTEVAAPVTADGVAAEPSGTIASASPAITATTTPRVMGRVSPRPVRRGSAWG
jgi:hypothetical protein